MTFSSPFNIPLWLKELEGDEDEQFLRDGLINGFPLNPTDISYEPAEMLNYKSATHPSVRDKVEAVIKEEMELGGYVVVQNKPTIVSALGAIPKPDSSNIRLIHDCSMPPSKGFTPLRAAGEKSRQCGTSSSHGGRENSTEKHQPVSEGISWEPRIVSSHTAPQKIAKKISLQVTENDMMVA